MTATHEIQPTSAKQWKGKSSAPVELPSGNFIRIRKMSMSALLATGKLPNSLINVIKKAVDRGTGMAGVEDQMNELISDDKQLAEMARFMDTFVCMISVDPKIHPTPAKEKDRQEDLLYADEVDEEDKSFLFQLTTGGTSDLEQFRAATKASVAAVPGREDIQLPAERTAEAD